MKTQRSAKQFYPKVGSENLPSDALLSEESARLEFGSFGQSQRQPSDKTDRAQAGQVPRSQAGQVVVEYVVLLLIAISIAVLMINLVVSRQEGNEGFLIKAWTGIIKTISSDATDEVPPANPQQQN